MSVPVADDATLLTLDEIRKLLKVNKDSLFKHVLPTLPTLRLGRRRLVRACDLSAWLAARVESPGSDHADAISGERVSAQDAILTALRRRPDGMTRTQISTEVFQRHMPGGAIALALRALNRRGLADFTKEPAAAGDGRPSELWFARTEGADVTTSAQG